MGIHPWTRLIPVADHEFFSPELRRRIAEVARNVGGLVQARADLDAAADRLRDADAATVDANDLLVAGNQWAMVVEYLQDELRLREQIAALELPIRGELAEALNQAIDEHSKTESKIWKQLRSLGYDEPVAGEPIPTAITPDMIHRHPAVRAARLKAESIRGFLSSNDAGRENEAAIAEVRHRLAEIASKHVSA